MGKMKITVFADPVCTWCWGSVPVLRALEYRLGESVEVDYVMGGMIEDITKFSNRRLGIGGDIALSNRNMHKAWVDASAVHGMPVCEHGFRLFSEEHRSTVPQNMAYIAAKIYVAKAANKELSPGRFLRRLQEATAVDAALTCDPNVIADLAAVEGFEPARLAEIMRSREAQRLYEEDKEKCRHYEVQTFPTYLLVYKGVELMLRGFTSYDTIVQNIKQLSYGKIVPCDEAHLKPMPENVERFIEKYGSVYPVEIATAFALQRISGKSAINVESYVGLPDIIDELVRAGKIIIRPRGNGFVLYAEKHFEGRPAEVDEVPAETGF